MTLNADGRTGVISGRSRIGDVVIGFDYVVEQAKVTLTVMQKPMFVPVPMIWAEFAYALREAERELGQMRAGNATGRDRSDPGLK
jgi:hypothetical protein